MGIDKGLSDEKPFTAWLTKYALTLGIQERQVVQSSSVPDIVSLTGNRLGNSYHGEGRDWHRTRASAVARANQMRKAKLASLNKSIAKLEKMVFE